MVACQAGQVFPARQVFPAKAGIFGRQVFENSRSIFFKGHDLPGARHFSLGHQKSHGNFNVKKISDYTNSTLLILLRPLISFYLVAFAFYYGKEKSNLILHHGPLKSDSSYKT